MCVVVNCGRCSASMNRSPWCVATTMPSKMSRSATSRTCSRVPICSPELLSTGVPRVAAAKEIGVPSVMPPPAGSCPGLLRRGRTYHLAQAAQLRGRAAEGELVLLGGGEVPVQQMRRVDSDAAVNVHGGVRDPMPAFGRPELRRCDLLVGWQASFQAPCRLPHGQPDRLHVDISIGQ